MNIINKVKLNFYPELKKLNIDDKTLEKIISNKNFNYQYNTNIKPFIKFLQEYERYGFKSDKNSRLDDSTIKYHMKAVCELSIKNSADKYISFIEKDGYGYIEDKLINYEVFSDPNFDKLYSKFGKNIFKENIAECIKKGYSDRLLELENNHDPVLNQIKPELFSDKVWGVIVENPSIGSTTFLDLFRLAYDKIPDLINEGLFEGMKYTYENIPESHGFFETLYHGNRPIKQFSMEFINGVENDTLKTLYERDSFGKNENLKIFEIADSGNYELIKDIVNYNKNNPNFSFVSSDDVKKSIFEIDTKVAGIDKKKLFLTKYFEANPDYIKLFIDSINKANELPDEFVKKYGNLLDLINRVNESSNEEIINISKTFDLNKKDEYKKLLEDCERDGNEVLQKIFVKELKVKNDQIINSTEHKKIATKNGDFVDVYELTGQPFTMLIHNITNNNLSIHDKYVDQILSNPKEWNNIEDGNNYISTSLISDKLMNIYAGKSRLMFGFYNLPSHSIKVTDTQDFGTNREAPNNADFGIRNRMYLPKINTIATIDDLINKTKGQYNYNEVVITRADALTGEKFKPDYIVCFDNVNNDSIKASLEFSVPIYLIKSNCYNNISIDKNNVESESDYEIESKHTRK